MLAGGSFLNLFTNSHINTQTNTQAQNNETHTHTHVKSFHSRLIPTYTLVANSPFLYNDTLGDVSFYSSLVLRGFPRAYIQHSHVDHIRSLLMCAHSRARTRTNTCQLQVARTQTHQAARHPWFLIQVSHTSAAPTLDLSCEHCAHHNFSLITKKKKEKYTQQLLFFILLLFFFIILFMFII